MQEIEAKKQLKASEGAHFFYTLIFLSASGIIETQFIEQKCNQNLQLFVHLVFYGLIIWGTYILITLIPRYKNAAINLFFNFLDICFGIYIALLLFYGGRMYCKCKKQILQDFIRNYDKNQVRLIYNPNMTLQLLIKIIIISQVIQNQQINHMIQNILNTGVHKSKTILHNPIIFKNQFSIDLEISNMCNVEKSKMNLRLQYTTSNDCQSEAPVLFFFLETFLLVNGIIFAILFLAFFSYVLKRFSKQQQVYDENKDEFYDA